MNNKFDVLVIGCKKHEQIAKRFYDLAFINWPEINDSLLFCTDEESDYQKAFAKGHLVCEPNQNYADRIKKGLNEVNSDYVLLVLDDYYFSKRINQQDFVQLINNLKGNDIEYCKLIGLPKCFKKYKLIKGARCIKEKTHYGVSLQPSIWKKESLLEALSLCNGSSAWEVEAAFSEFQNKHFSRCLTFNKNVLSIKNGVLRGKLAPGTNKLLKINGVEELDLQKVGWLRYKLFMSKQHISMHLPIFVRSFGKKIGRLFGKRYYSDK